MEFKVIIPALIGIIVGLAGSPFVEAATSSASVTLHVEIVSQAALSAATTDFADNKTRRISGVSAKKSGARVTADVRTGSSPATLTVVASDDSVAGMEIIPDAFVTAKTGDTTCYFSSDGTGTKRNTSSSGKVDDQGCSGSYTEMFNMYLAKNWNCTTGIHAYTLTYTLAAP